MIRAAMRELLKRKRGEDRVNVTYSVYMVQTWSVGSNVLPDIILGESHKTCQESGLHLSQKTLIYLAKRKRRIFLQLLHFIVTLL